MTQSETKFEIGEDLYGVSVDELRQRIGVLTEEIARIEGELSKKELELSAANTLFAKK